MWRRVLPCALLLVLPLAGAGPGAAATAEVVIDTALRPAELTVPVGTAVTWRNAHAERHRVRTTSAPVEIDSGNIDPGEAFTATLGVAGTYRYVDDRDRENAAYWGTIVVTGSSPGTEPPPAPGGAVTPPAPGGPPPPSGGSPAPAAPAPSSASVAIVDRAFSPPTVRIAAGGTASWANQDDRAHTVTARDGSFDSGIVAAGQGFSRVFAGPGTFPYFCVVHPEMTGTVEVVDASGTAPPPAPPSGVPAGGGGPGGGTAAGAVATGSAPGAGSAAAGAGSAAATPAGAAGAAPPTSAAVSVVDFAFQPSSVTVSVSGTVSWVNRGVAPHTVTAADGSFDSGIFAAGRSYSFRFPRAGTFSYRCTLHPQMQGTVVVRQADGATPTPGVAGGTTPGDGGGAGEGSDSAIAQDGEPSESRSGSASGPRRSRSDDVLAGTSRQTPGRAMALVAVAVVLGAFAAGTALAPRVRRLGRLLPLRLRRS